MDGPTLTPETPLTEYARAVMAAELLVIEAHVAGLRDSADTTAVHETRKAIRRLRSLFKLFQPIFKKKTLRTQRRRLRAFMRVLAPARDAAVFLQKLEQFRAESAEAATGEAAVDEAALADLAAVWEQQKAAIDRHVIDYAHSAALDATLAELAAFTRTPGRGNRSADAAAPTQTRFLAPQLVVTRLAALRHRALSIDFADAHALHQLRIQFKELRYTLEAFQPLLGAEAEEPLALVKQILDHLGDLNDATVHRQLLAQTDGAANGVALYDGVKSAEITHLITTFDPLWQAFNTPAWREPVFHALAQL